MANPVDAHRKALKKKEARKNRSERKKNEEVKEKLEAKRRAEENEKKTQEAAAPSQKRRDPTRSIYYHPTFNPLGAPPPGMPYKEVESDSEDGLSDIALPGADDSESTDSGLEDVALPPGPPPWKGGKNKANIARPKRRYEPSGRGGGGPLGPGRSVAAGGHARSTYQPFASHPNPAFSAGPQPAYPMQPQFPTPPQFPAQSQYSAQPHLNPRGPIVNAPNAKDLPAIIESATISAEPQLRDLKKEAAVFVPSAVVARKRKEASAKKTE